jgi:hypothetical protein
MGEPSATGVLHTLHNTKYCKGPPGVLRNIAQSIITNDQVFDLLPHSGEHSSLNLQFRAPQFQCTVLVYNHSVPFEHPSDGSRTLTNLTFESKWHSDQHLLYSVMKHDAKSLTVKRSPDNETTYEANMETFAQSCKPNSMLYNVTISFPRSVRQIQHTLSDARPVPDPVDVYDIDSQSIQLDLPAEPQALRT